MTTHHVRTASAEVGQMQGIALRGVDGANPLGFLSALGALRGLTVAAREGPPGASRSVPASRKVTMRWTMLAGAWRPVIDLPGLTEEMLLGALLDQCRLTAAHPTLALGDNFTLGPEEYAEHARARLSEADPHVTAFLAALGSDAVVTDQGKVADTALRTMSGAGHQHFLRTMRAVLEQVGREHLERALLRSWDYGDPMRNLSLRLDPLDDRRYALQWSDPSGDPSRAIRGSMLGANALAVVGLPMIRVAPVSGVLETTGFTGRGSSDRFWSWPIWEVPATMDVARCLLALPEVVAERPDRARLRAMGVVAVHRSRRVTTGKFRNFSPSQAV